MEKNRQWDHEVDVIVLGTGGAALTAAILAHDHGAKVLVLEKSSQIGGTTAISGGILWAPMNRFMKEAGIQDSRDDVLKYIRRLTHGKEANPELVEVFVDQAWKTVDYLCEHTPLQLAIPKDYGDYYANLPGGIAEGRSLEPVPYDLNQLGEWADRIRRNPITPPITYNEGLLANTPEMYSTIAERMEKNITTMGRSLIGFLLQALLERKVEILLETAGKELVQNDKGEVIGVCAEQNGNALFIGARKGVILATGGFEWNQELVHSFLRGSATHPLSPPFNEGDGLVMAMEAGAALGNMSDAWWYPAVQDPTIEYEGHVFNYVRSARSYANSMIVNRHGKRFVNEGSTYLDISRSFYKYDEVTQDYPNQPPVWNIFDSQLKERALILTMMPGEPAPDWLPQADNLRDLAKKIGVDPDGLEDTVRQFNENAAKRVDPDYHRGTLYFEDLPNHGGSPEANLGPINTAPYYALPIYSGMLGTAGGPSINANGQVISLRGEPIAGLYAAGNAAVGVLSPAYPGAGTTIGPGLTFGYLAGIAAAQETAREI